MGIPSKVKNAIMPNSGIRQRTFTFTLNEVERANEVLDQFCDEHTVLGVVFDRVNSTLLYRCIYKN